MEKNWVFDWGEEKHQEEDILKLNPIITPMLTIVKHYPYIKVTMFMFGNQLTISNFNSSPLFSSEGHPS